MTPKITFDMHKFAQAAERMVAETGKGIAEVLKEQAKLFIADVAHLTPPTGKHPLRSGGEKSESFAIQRGYGNRAIAFDLHKIFKGPDDLEDVPDRVIEKAKEYSRKGEFEKLKTMLGRMKIKWQIIAGATHDIHNRCRDSRGRTLKGRKFFVMNQDTVKKLIQELQKRVGMAKSGWTSAANAVGFHLPAWITRHAQPGLYIENLASRIPSITIGNLVQFAQKHNRTMRIIQRALDNRAEKMHNRLDKMMQKQAEKLNRS